MLVDNYANVRDNFKTYFDKVVQDKETIIIARKEGKNAVVMPLDEYNNLKEVERKYTYMKIMDQINGFNKLNDDITEDTNDVEVSQKNIEETEETLVD